MSSICFAHLIHLLRQAASLIWGLAPSPDMRHMILAMVAIRSDICLLLLRSEFPTQQLIGYRAHLLVHVLHHLAQHLMMLTGRVFERWNRGRLRACRPTTNAPIYIASVATLLMSK